MSLKVVNVINYVPLGGRKKIGTYRGNEHGQEACYPCTADSNLKHQTLPTTH